MYKEQVPGLPPANSTAAVRKKMEGLVGHQLSVDRNKLKDQLSATLEADQDEYATDVASVTAALLSSWRLEVPLTLQVLWHMALIRRNLKDNETTADDFWEVLDKSMHECRMEGAGSLAIALQEVFKEDIQNFGDMPSTLEFDSDIGPHSLPWLQRVDKLAVGVDHPKLVNPKAKAKKAPGKRKRSDTDDAPAGEAE
ncbi:hypothetical protein MKEN_00637800 [Mycena kentingensis (nom. inval.)]|nr:hypothetical protein MKEN_00637800 [Mycena kentingensis (nom. inval.)]